MVDCKVMDAAWEEVEDGMWALIDNARLRLGLVGYVQDKHCWYAWFGHQHHKLAGTFTKLVFAQRAVENKAQVAVGQAQSEHVPECNCIACYDRRCRQVIAKPVREPQALETPQLSEAWDWMPATAVEEQELANIFKTEK